MDRTMIGVCREEEKVLSEALYKKLKGLCLLHPPSEALRNILNESMFLKSNMQAFLQVMHYLFKLHDAAEFKKRFYWPITDKKGEASFRTSTVEYLKHLNEKHNLNWDIKSYLVVLPGGMKFIKFMLELVGFVLHEQIKQREKQLGPVDWKEFPPNEATVQRLRNRSELFKEYASQYMKAADEEMEKLKEKTVLIQQELEGIRQVLLPNSETPLDAGVLAHIKQQNEKLFEQNVVKPIAAVKQLEAHLEELQQAVGTFLTSAEAENMKKSHTDAEKELETFIANESNIDNYLSAMAEVPHAGEFATDELKSLSSVVTDLEAQATNFQQNLQQRIKEFNYTQRLNLRTPMRNNNADASGANNCNENEENELLKKFMSTPPIRFEVMEGTLNARTRLPLLEDFAANAILDRTVMADANRNHLAVPRSIHKLKHDKSNLSLNTTLGKSKIMNAIQLLNSICNEKNFKTPQPKDKSHMNMSYRTHGNNLQQLGLPAIKVNEYGAEELMHDKINQNTMHSPSTPVTALDKNRQMLTHALQDMSVENVDATKISMPKRLSAVHKVQDETLSLLNLSSSPSGRLDPLVPFDLKDFENGNKIVEDILIKQNAENASGKTENSKFQAGRKLAYNIEYENEEDILNTSDGVLKDVIM